MKDKYFYFYDVDSANEFMEGNKGQSLLYELENDDCIVTHKDNKPLEYSAERVASRTDWPDGVAWVVKIAGESFDFNEGIGHFIKQGATGWIRQGLKNLILHGHKGERSDLTKHDYSFLTDRVKRKPAMLLPQVTITPPTIQSVLTCLVSDAQCGREDFDDFCDSMGYDKDSRKAHKTWKACVKIHTQLTRMGIIL